MTKQEEFLQGIRQSTVKWVDLTREQQIDCALNYMRTIYETEQQIYQAQQEELYQIQLEKEAEKQQNISFLRSKGFECDNSLSDWKKLYGLPELQQFIGPNHEQKAEDEFSLSPNVEYFVKVAIDMLKLIP